MSDQQLKVADLLARASKEQGARPTRARRRRRSLDEGGISVAELTGSIPRVNQAPKQPRHSAHPIDDTTDSDTPAQAKQTSQPARENQASQPAHGSHESHGSGASQANHAGQADHAVQVRQARRSPSTQDDHDTVVLQVVEEGDPVRLTTGTFPAIKADQAKPGAAYSSATSADSRAAQSRVAQSRSAETSLAESRSAAEAKTASAVDDAPSPRAKDAKGTKDAWANDTRVTGTLAKGDAEKNAVAVDEKKPDLDDFFGARPSRRGEVERVEDANLDAATRDDAEADLAEDAEERPRMSVVTVVCMVAVGLILGLAIFKGFQLLWANFSTTMTSILAVAVTAAMVGITHALRTHRAVLTMVIVAVVGLVLTFGPSLITGI